MVRDEKVDGDKIDQELISQAAAIIMRWEAYDGEDGGETDWNGEKAAREVLALFLDRLGKVSENPDNFRG